MTYQKYVTFESKEAIRFHVFVDYQPFQFDNNRYSLIFNGEIYNVRALYDYLQEQGYYIETELVERVIASLFIVKGVEAFAMLRGMFSILIWDHKRLKMYGARDRFGIKPLYYMENDNDTTFTTKNKQIEVADRKDYLCSTALQHYLSFQYVPGPMTMAKGIRQVKPGHYFIKEYNKPILFKCYFHATLEPVLTDRNQLMKQIRNTLIDSIDVHMQSDLSIGSFLSGGIDSSIIVSVAKKFNPNLKTFSVGFEREGYSEIDVAKKTADELGVENISLIITPEEYVAQLPEVLWHMEDPLADPSSVPLYHLAREAGKHVDGVLSGEGADELFGGYNIYREFNSLKVFRVLPPWINKVLRYISTLFPEGMKGKSFIERGTTPLRDRYIGNAKIFEESEKEGILKNYEINTPYQTITNHLYDDVAGQHSVNQMQYIDIHTWLPGNILLKAQKISVAHSLDIRVPFLDKDVFNIARTIPVHNKVAEGTTKLILRQAFEGMVPDHVLYRKKLGFPVPIKQWLRGELYTWAKQLIHISKTDYLINKKEVLYLLEQHALKKGDYARRIWTILSFMVWHQVFIEQVYTFGKLNEKVPTKN